MEHAAPRTPERHGRHNGLAYALWLPDVPAPYPGVLVVHGAGSRKENHGAFARLATANGWAALTFDLPGHGESEPEMTGAAVAGVVSMADLSTRAASPCEAPVWAASSPSSPLRPRRRSPA